jgi:acetyl-CoA carboxylase, biotin carboxylase subunit
LFNKILIANRGEIAVRIVRACKELRIKSAAVFSETDKTQLHVRLADEAYLLGPAPSSESYLNISKIITLAKEIGADAIHPGYGFLSENASFIKAVEESGIIFIGPSSASVNLMGSKTEARRTMIENGVPVVPGTIDPISSVEDGKTSAGKIGYPILLKASAGGGGKGMKKVEKESEFEKAFLSAQREARKAFNSDLIYIEKYIQDPKHIEVQVIADNYGNYSHIFERECSIQRRHQKIIEEAPSQFVDEETRKKITEAAVKAARACNYTNAGTVEFLMDNNHKFYFLEMNTRVQVEHPVTELITGIDIVKEQILISDGNKLSFSPDELKINGYAIECRLYAEDPQNNFLPSTGVIEFYRPPAGPGIRIDSGYESGSEVTMHYDPLLAKIICWGNSKENALRTMVRALNETVISGVTTNKEFLKEICLNKDFISGNYSINFLEDKLYLIKDNRNNIDAAVVFSVLMRQHPLKKQTDSVQSNNWIRLQNE